MFILIRNAMIIYMIIVNDVAIIYRYFIIITINCSTTNKFILFYFMFFEE